MLSSPFSYANMLLYSTVSRRNFFTILTPRCSDATRSRKLCQRLCKVKSVVPFILSKLHFLQMRGPTLTMTQGANMIRIFMPTFKIRCTARHKNIPTKVGRCTTALEPEEL